MEKHEKWFIYTLKDSTTNEIRYVGKTNNPRKRLEAHIYPGRSLEKVYSSRWIKSVIRKGGEPIMNIIESGTGNENWQAREMYWIDHYKNIGCKLTNTAIGGGGPSGWVPSQEYRDNVSKRMKGMEKSDITRAKLSKSLKGRIFSEDHRLALSRSMARSDKAKAAQKAATEAARKATKGKKQTREHIYNRSVSKLKATREQVALIDSLHGVISHKKIAISTGLPLSLIQGIRYNPLYDTKRDIPVHS